MNLNDLKRILTHKSWSLSDLIIHNDVKQASASATFIFTNQSNCKITIQAINNQGKYRVLLDLSGELYSLEIDATLKIMDFMDELSMIRQEQTVALVSKLESDLVF